MRLLRPAVLVMVPTPEALVLIHLTTRLRTVSLMRRGILHLREGQKQTNAEACAPLHQYSLNTPKSRVGVHLRLTCFVNNLLSVTKGPEQEGMGKKHMTAMCFLCVSLLDELLLVQKTILIAGFPWRNNGVHRGALAHVAPIGYQVSRTP